MSKSIYLRLITSLVLAAFVYACPKPPKPPEDPIELTSTELGQAYKKERIREKHKDKNLVELMTLIEIESGNPVADDALLLIARARMEAGDEDRAKVVIIKLLTDYPSSNSIDDAKLLLGRILFNAGKYNESAELLESLPKAVRSETKTALLLASAYLNAGKPIDAIDAYMSVRDELSEDRRGAKDKVIREAIAPLDRKPLRKIVRKFKGTFAEAEALAALGQLALEEGDAADAQMYAAKLLTKFPDDPAVRKAKSIMAAVKSLTKVNARAIGLLLPLSGSRARAGRKALHGAMLASNFLRPGPSALKMGFKLVIRDTKADPEVAARMAEELIIQEKVIAIIGPLYSRPAFAAAKVADDFKVPLIALSPTDNITSVGDTIFRNCITQQEQARILSWYAVKGLGKKNFAIMYPNNSFGKSYKRLFTKGIQKNGGAIVLAIPYNPKQTDFKKEIREIARIKRKIDAIFIPDGYRNVALIAPQLRFHNIFRMQLLGTREWNNPKLMQNISAKDVEGAIFVDGFWGDSYDLSVMRFVSEFKDTFGTRPGIIEAQTYEAVRVVLDLVDINDLQSRDELTTALRNLENYLGIYGYINMRDDRSFKKALFLLTIKDRRVIEIGK